MKDWEWLISNLGQSEKTRGPEGRKAEDQTQNVFLSVVEFQKDWFVNLANLLHKGQVLIEKEWGSEGWGRVIWFDAFENLESSVSSELAEVSYPSC